jgi:hypothetical protein
MEGHGRLRSGRVEARSEAARERFGHADAGLLEPSTGDGFLHSDRGGPSAS